MRNKIRNPKSEIRNASGFTYVALLAAIIILGISMAAAGKFWSYVMQREREEELLFRGEQYSAAIGRYFNANKSYPQSIESLLNETDKLKRNLRQQYKDPITGEDFELFRDMTKGNRITGVYSKSDKAPLKKAGFPEHQKDFENKTAYNEWKFIYTLPTPTRQAGTIRSQGGIPPAQTTVK